MVLSSVVGAQDNTASVLQQNGIPVRLPASNQATVMPDADRADATVITISAEGDVYLGAQPTDIAVIAGLRVPFVYVKADAQAPYQQVLTILSALNNHQVILLTQPTGPAMPGKLMPPYGVSVSIGH